VPTTGGSRQKRDAGSPGGLEPQPTG